MTLRVLSVSAGISGFPNLSALESRWFGGRQTPSGELPDRIKLVRAAAGGAGAGSDTRLGVIAGSGWSAADLEEGLGRKPSSFQILENKRSFLPDAFPLAETWCTEHPEGILLLTAGGREAAGCLVLGSNSGQAGKVHPALAVLDRLDSSEELTRAVGEASAALGERRRWIGLLELAGDMNRLDPVNLPALDQALGISAEFPTTALSLTGSHDRETGDFLALIRAVLSLHRKTIPGSISPAELPETGSDPVDSFYIPELARPWLKAGPEFERIALTAGTLPAGQGAWAVTLTEASRVRELPPVRTAPQSDSPWLIPVSGSDPGDLISNLDRIEELLRAGSSLEELGRNGYAKLSSANEPGLVISLIGTDPQDLQHEIEHARKGVQKALESGAPWNSPRGSCFTPDPLGDHPIALVYPGAFNSYPGMGRELFQTFPPLHQLVEQTTSNISHSLAERLLYPRTLEPLDEQQRKNLAQKMFQHPVELIESGTSLSVLHTLILKEIFQIQPKAAFGYSLGEISMLWANGIWRHAEESSRRWQRSPLFRTQLFGPKTAVQESWGENDPPDDFWASFILKAPREEAARAVSAQDRVYLTISNAPGEVVIAGDRGGCRQVIDRLNCHALPMPFDAVIHNPAMASTYPQFVELYSREIYPQSEMAFYSAAGYEPLELKQDAVAERTAAMTCSPVDFPRLVEKVYRDGARIFIEVGPQRTCSRWIERILKDKPHAVIPVNKKYQPDYQGILKVLSLLLTHRVSLDLSALYPEEVESPAVPETSRSSSIEAGPGPSRPPGRGRKNSSPGSKNGSGKVLGEKVPGGKVPGGKIPGGQGLEGIRMEGQDLERIESGGGKSGGKTSDGIKSGGNGRLPEGGRLTPGKAARPGRPSEVQGSPAPADPDPPTPDWLDFYRHLDRHSARTAESHRSFLHAQAALTRDSFRLLGLDKEDAGPNAHAPPSRSAPRFTTQQIQAFTTGDPADCFGELFADFGGRRIPRLPNGPLRMIDRILEIDGPRGEIREGAVLTSAFDLPSQAWYLQAETGALACAALMEAALQPCGFLSAYQGTIQKKSDLDFYFRNLDGEAALEFWPDLRGRTIHNRVQLLSSSTLGSTIIQKYSFELSLEDRVFYSGESSFGYFTPPMLQNQAGLDGGSPRRPWLRDHPRAGSWLNDPSPGSAGTPQIPSLPRPDRLWAAPAGGVHEKGYLYLTFQPRPQDWYFKAHFYQDPVMPGSLGVQLIIEALKLGARSLGLPGPGAWQLAPGAAVWKYRGQVTPDSDGLEAEVHLKKTRREGSRLSLTADASLWNGGKRIYQISDLTLEQPGGTH